MLASMAGGHAWVRGHEQAGAGACAEHARQTHQRPRGGPGLGELGQHLPLVGKLAQDLQNGSELLSACKVG